MGNERASPRSTLQKLARRPSIPDRGDASASKEADTRNSKFGQGDRNFTVSSTMLLLIAAETVVDMEKAVVVMGFAQKHSANARQVCQEL